MTVSAGSGESEPQALPGIGQATGVPNIARVYDFLLGGKDNLSADRLLAARITQTQPLVVAGVRSNRAFMRRAVAFLAAQGIDQFLDIGSGLPTADNVHEVTGRVSPQARTVYVDCDPIVLVHARALLAGSNSIVVEGDVRAPGKILAHPDVRAHLDFARPVAVVMCAILHFVADHEDAAGIAAAFRDVMAPGSALVITHVVDDGDNGSAATRAAAEVYAETTAPFVLRSREQVAAWFTGFRLVEPGLVDADLWRRAGTGKTTAPIVAGVGLLPENPPTASE